MSDFLKELPSGAWVVFGGLLTLIVTVLLEFWRTRREDKNAKRARAEFVSDRQREERRSAYLELIRTIKQVQAEIGQEQAREIDDPIPRNATFIAKDSARLRGRFPEASAMAALVAGDALREQIDRVTSYLYGEIHDLMYGQFLKSGNTRENPVSELEATMARELEYRDSVDISRLDIAQIAVIESAVEKVIGEWLKETRSMGEQQPKAEG